MKKIISIFMSVCMLLSITAGLNLTAYAETEGYYTYSVWYGEATITDCDNSISGDVEIPSTLGGYPVTSIGYSAFSNCTSLTSITIGNSVTSIGEEAFYGCQSLTSITIGNSVTSIGKEAFVCESLTSIDVASSNINYSSEDGVLFNKDKTNLIQYPIGNTRTSYTIPNSVTSIGNYAFSRCTCLTSVTIPDSVTSIGRYAFSWCTNLTNITIPNGVTSIGDGTFRVCEKLISITIPNSVTTIGIEAFAFCESLISITIPDSVTSVGYGAFSRCTSLESVTIGNGVTSIGDSAFSECERITSIIIPDSVTSIGEYAFCDCQSLTSITIGNSVTSIGYDAFCNCTSLKTITIPDSVTSIGYNAFFCCTSLESINVNSLNEYYSSQDGVLFDENNETLIQYPIGNTRTSYTIPDSVTRIAERAFEFCTSLTSIIIPDSVTSIGDWAFSSCASIKCIDVDFSNENYSSQDGVLFDKNKETLMLYPVGNTRTSYTIPDSVTSIEEYAFSSCASLTSIVIPDSVTGIDKYAFNNCTSLTDVYYIGSEADWQKIYIGWYNEYLTNATIHYNSTMPEPTTIDIRIGTKEFYNITGDQTIIVDSLDLSDITVLMQNGVDIEGASDEWSMSTKYLDGEGRGVLEVQIFDETSDSVTFNLVSHYGDCPDAEFKNFQIMLITAHMHQYISNVTKAPTCAETGVLTITCACGDTKTEDIPKTTVHTPEVIPAVPATCSKSGLTEGSKCSVCGAILVEQKVVDKLPTPTPEPTPTPTPEPATQPTTEPATTTTTPTTTTTDTPAATTTKVSVPKITLKTVKSKKSKQVTVTWKKNTKVTGYEIQYSTDKKFKKSVKKATIKKNKTTSTTIKKLKSKKKYYVRIRAYKTVNGKKYYSSWSKAMTVTTK